ncbi:MAG TPA: hypothetical protein ENJ64_05915 [Thiotrichales bacterium]|nr:hypothetical protein [Thiotrichales bacterium]
MPVKQTLHKLASPLLYRSGFYRQFWLAKNRQQPFTFVAFYHRVVADSDIRADNFDIENGMPASAFEQQMRFLLKHFTPVKASQAQQVQASRMQFAITLDDGYEDNYLVAAPILKKLGIPATFYVVSDFVGTDRLFWWEQVADIVHNSRQSVLDLQAVMPQGNSAGKMAALLPLGTAEERDIAYGQLCSLIRHGRHADIASHLERVSDYFSADIREEGRRYALMNWEQLRELAHQGFEIGGHTASHCNVIGEDKILLQRELVDSISQIEAELDHPVESFAYPYGLFEPGSKTVPELLGSTNCKAAYTIEQGMVTAERPAFELPRAKLNRAYDFACAFNVQDTLLQRKS